MDFKLLHIPLKMLKLYGLYPQSNSWVAKTINIATAVTNTLLLSAIIIEMCNREWTFLTITPLVETLGAVIEVFTVETTLLDVQ